MLTLSLSASYHLFTLPPPSTPPFPYTTLFRSPISGHDRRTRFPLGDLAALAQLRPARRGLDRRATHGDHPHLREQLRELLELARQSRLAGERSLRGERRRQRDLAARARAESRLAHRGAVRLHVKSRA